MTQLSDRQIAQHVAAGGFTGDNQVIGVAVVLAESGGRTDARGDLALVNKTWGPSIGLFQIRSLNAQRGTGQARDELANLDPAANARHAHRVFVDAGSRWSPWSTFNSGSYRHFLERARAVVPGSSGHSPQVSVGSAGVHVVQAGESLSSIARAHGVSLDTLRALNPGLFNAAHQDGNLIRPGERVVLGTHSPSDHGTSNGRHTVRIGDTLSGIAKAHGLSLDALRALNPGLFDAAHDHGNSIKPGEVVRI